MIKLKYGHIAERITSFNADDEPISWHPYKKGEL